MFGNLVKRSDRQSDMNTMKCSGVVSIDRSCSCNHTSCAIEMVICQWRNAMVFNYLSIKCALDLV